MAKTKTKKMREQASELSDRIAPTVESAREKVAPLVSEAREKTAPLIAEAREKAGTATTEARDVLTSEVLPVLTAAVAAAGAATEDVRGETKKRGKAVAAALKGEVEAPKKSHKLRNLLLLLGLGGLAAFVAKKLSDREPTTAWQSSYTPTPAAGATGGAHKAGESPDADDQGGASPDVAAADAAATPHEATTPDNPAETIDVSKK